MVELLLPPPPHIGMVSIIDKVNCTIGNNPLVVLITIHPSEAQVDAKFVDRKRWKFKRKLYHYHRNDNSHPSQFLNHDEDLTSHT